MITEHIALPDPSACNMRIEWFWRSGNTDQWRLQIIAKPTDNHYTILEIYDTAAQAEAALAEMWVRIKMAKRLTSAD